MRSSAEMTGNRKPVASVEDHPVFQRVGKTVTPSIAVNQSQFLPADIQAGSSPVVG